MIGFVVIDDNPAHWHPLAARLRGVLFLSCHRQVDSIEVNRADAVAFFKKPADDEVIAWALRAGKHVLLCVDEWISRSRIDRWTALARVAKVRLAVLNPARYLPSRQLIRQQLDAGKLGAPGFVRLHHWAPAGTEAGTVGADLDLILWYFGTAPDLVYAVENAATLQVHLGFPGGGMALLDRASLPAGDTYDSLSIIGSAGAAYADDAQNMHLLYGGGLPTALRADETLGPWIALVQAFSDVVEYDSHGAELVAGSEPYPTWAEVLTVIDAVEKSLRTKQSVPIGGGE